MIEPETRSAEPEEGREWAVTGAEGGRMVLWAGGVEQLGV